MSLLDHVSLLVYRLHFLNGDSGTFACEVPRMPCRALLELPRWVASGGRDFTFYHSYPGLSMGSEEADANFASVICNNFQWATLLAAEQVMRPRTALQLIPDALAVDTRHRFADEGPCCPGVLLAPQSQFMGICVSLQNSLPGVRLITLRDGL